MRRKLRGRRGMTLVEMLAASVVLILLGLMLHTGLLMAQSSYRVMTGEAESQLLLSTLSDLLSNELRYARDVAVDGSGALTRYTSVNYGRNTTLSLDGDGQLEASNRLMLPSGAYGNGDCRIDQCAITYSGGIFHVMLAVSDRRGASCETTFSIRCLNGEQLDTETEGEGT